MSLANRITQTVSDFTIGAMIVLAHTRLANRAAQRRRVAQPDSFDDGTPLWRTQISP